MNVDIDKTISPYYGSEWIYKKEKFIITGHKVISSARVCVFTNRRTVTFQMDQIADYFDDIVEADQDTVKNSVGHLNRKEQQLAVKAIKVKKFESLSLEFKVENKANQLQKIVAETTGTAFRMGIDCEGENWKIYIIQSKVNLEAPTLDEVIQMAIEEFLSHREINPNHSHSAFPKPFRYV